jgi:hypothetical protein
MRTDNIHLSDLIVKNQAGMVVAIPGLSASAFVSTHDTGDRHEIL